MVETHTQLCCSFLPHFYCTVLLFINATNCITNHLCKVYSGASQMQYMLVTEVTESCSLSRSKTRVPSLMLEPMNQIDTDVDGSIMVPVPSQEASTSSAVAAVDSSHWNLASICSCSCSCGIWSNFTTTLGTSLGSIIFWNIYDLHLLSNTVSESSCWRRRKTSSFPS